MEQKKRFTYRKSNVLKISIEDGSWFCLRPLELSRKIKFYFGVKDSSLQKGEQKLPYY